MIQLFRGQTDKLNEHMMETITLHPLCLQGWHQSASSPRMQSVLIHGLDQRVHFWGLTHGFSYYNCFYSIAQRTNGRVLQTAKNVYFVYTFGSWGNDHQVDPWAQFTNVRQT